MLKQLLETYYANRKAIDDRKEELRALIKENPLMPTKQRQSLEKRIDLLDVESYEMSRDIFSIRQHITD